MKQILDMKHNELKMLADHIGHNLHIHSDIDKMQSSIIEKAKVARILIAAENGSIANFTGMGLEAIDIDGKCHLKFWNLGKL